MIRTRPSLAALSSIFVGTCFFLIIVGDVALNPRNVNWLFHGINSDPVQHYLGWLYFNQDEWRIPLGKNPDYGVEISSSIVYSDSIPILALVAKAFSPLISGNYQYFGIWLLIIFILQAFFSHKIASLYTSRLTVATLSSALMCATPFLLWRMQAHIALTSHFLILWCIYLILKTNKSENDESMSWNFILFLSSLVHAYLLLMTLSLWIGWLFDRFFVRLKRPTAGLQRLLLGMVVVLGTCFFVAGYDFSHSNSMSGTSVEYGVYRWNPVSPLTTYGTATLLRFLPNNQGNFDTYTYLGAGFIFLFGFVLIFNREYIPRIFIFLKRNPFLGITLVALTLVSITNKVAIGNLRWSFWLPDIVIDTLSVFSASARFIWPVLYFAIISAIVLLIVSLRGKNIAIWIMCTALILQVMDLRPLITKVNNFTSSVVKVSYPLSSSAELSDDLRGDFDEVLVVPSLQRENPGFPDLTILALQRGWSTNSVYLSRLNVEAARESKKTIEKALSTGNLKPNTWYVLFGDDINLLDPLRTAFKIIKYKEVYFVSRR